MKGQGLSNKNDDYPVFDNKDAWNNASHPKNYNKGDKVIVWRGESAPCERGIIVGKGDHEDSFSIDVTHFSGSEGNVEKSIRNILPVSSIKF